MTTAKTTRLTYHNEPNLKDAVRTAADREHRSIANMFEVMILDYCDRVGAAILDLRVLHTQDGTRPISRQRKALN